ncbi:MAG: hypothetical protein KJZ69_07845 [Phycisphaerales bacterium]|nr:hypothetical protein [Phycisphaerales bacterium]
MKPRGSFRLALWGFVAAALCAAPAMAQYEPVLMVEGSCPGKLRAEVTGAPPRRTVLLLFASETGAFRIPPYSQHCGGVILGLGRRNLQQVDAQNTDEFGMVVFEGMAGPFACGGYLQALTSPIAGCDTTNVVRIE